MSYYIDLQQVSKSVLPFSDYLLKKWAKLPLIEHMESAELTLRFVDSEEIKQLNCDYRKKNKATNVLAFPIILPENIELESPLLGDVIICPEILEQESKELDKPLEEHWAHIIIHGVLHLLGYDHIKDNDAEEMQAFEIKLLAKLGFANPYKIEDEDVG
jgi:probable rRNA maturation factor